jgi:TolB-like protein/DNA-binding winged helix-turn-helix (wHTH) protein/cytochrome c-type biogenesis protein CcmH/NrfG
VIPSPEPAKAVRFGPFELDLKTCCLTRRGQQERLAVQPARLLVRLVERRGELVTREELRLQLWPGDTFGDFDHGLNNAVNRLREALGDSAASPRYIQTAPRRGYRFIADVEVVVPAQVGETDASLPGEPNTGEVRETAALPDVKQPDASERRVPAAGTVAEPPRYRHRGWMLALIVPFFLLSAFLLKFRTHKSESAAPIRSIAVLPLQNLSGKPDEEYFADGLTDELITELAHIPGLRVVSRTSVMQYKGTRKSLAQIVRELGVDAIVEGSVVRSGDRARITAQLIDVRSDKHLWAQSFEGPLGDILSLQDSVAREIALQTSSVLTPAARAEMTNARHVNPEAHDAYLRGLYFIQRRDGDLAASYFRKAIALQPDYGAANAGLAEALVTQYLASGKDAAQTMPLATAAARRAIEIDPYSGEAYTALGAIDTNFLYDWNAAEQNLLKGIELSPSSSDAETWYAIYLTSVARPAEAVNAMQRAVTLDPLSFWANRLLGSMLFYARRYDESLAALKRALEIAPDRVGFVEGWNSDNYEVQGRYSEAFAADLKILPPDISAQDINSFRLAFATGGWKAYQEARIKYFLLRSDLEYRSNILAMSYVRLGNPTEAFRWFNRDLDDHYNIVFDLSADPRLDTIRSDERFRHLLRRVNLPH